jgi:uncharacterized RDD family membrane protein YckC
MKEGIDQFNQTITAADPGTPSRDQNLPNPGDQFGDYRIERELGRGGMGAVYEAEQLETGRRVALKVLAHKHDSSESRARFLREGRLAASINHPNSVYVYGTGEIEETPVIIMELIAGGTLQERVEQDGPLPVSKAVDAIIQVTSGLQAAQAAGILHRDVKPANCFEDADGKVKVGDFGLSISTEARGEQNLTLEGAFLGTPAFSSPEQLRGEELSVRSDIYAVGVTLYYLLTGRTPFEGKSTVQLFVNVLEKTASSPRAVRPDIPEALAKVVLRCLHKTAGERFSDYDELHRALLPFSAEAPVPAPIPLRFVAGFIDHILIIGVTTLVSYLILIVGDLMSYRVVNNALNPVVLASMLGSLLFRLVYFSGMEGRWGFSIGKGICRLRVVNSDRNPPGFLKAFKRAFIYLALPPLPIWISRGLVLAGAARFENTVLLIAQVHTANLILALLFVTVRQRNGLAAVHDLFSRTRVIRKPVLEARPALAEAEPEPVADTETMPRIGSYHVLKSLEKQSGSEWVLAYDSRLLRKIWIHVLPQDTPERPLPLRKIGRAGRLRWITGRRSAEENWDAYEALSGAALQDLVQSPQSWSMVRFWLLDLAEELTAAEQDDTTPTTLAIDRVWITAEGRAKLLDFPAPGRSNAESSTTAEGTGFLGLVASAALEGRNDPADKGHVTAPIPLHARSFLEKLPGFPNPGAAIDPLKRMLHKPASVSKGRRMALVGGCLAFPVFAALGYLYSIAMLDQFYDRYPQVKELNQVIGQRSAQRSVQRFMPAKVDEGIEDRLFSIYIADRFSDTVNDPNAWNSLFVRSMFTGSKGRFIEHSVQTYPNPTAQEIEEAAAAISLKLPKTDFFAMFGPWMPLFIGVGTLISYVGFPAMFAALFFRGGLVLLTTGVAVVRKDGLRASRWRVFWRSLVTWMPFFLIPVIGIAMLTPLIGKWPAVLVATAIIIGLTAWSLLLPERSLQDRLSGTRLVPR